MYSSQNFVMNIHVFPLNKCAHFIFPLLLQSFQNITPGSSQIRAEFGMDPMEVLSVHNFKFGNMRPGGGKVSRIKKI